jgi:NADPH2:quinone reductase
MKASFIDATGKSDVIRYGEIPTPEPKPGEVRVKMAAASVNPIDTYIRGGLIPMPAPFPYIPGCDVAGTVEAVGTGVTRFKVGDRVWGSNLGLMGRQGSFAEYCCAPQEFLYPLSAGVAETEAAALALVGITAHLGLFWRTNTTAADTVFVNGGTGGVGMCVIQMAKAIGATVITTVGSDTKAALAKQLGADHVINYKTEDVSAKVKEATEGRGASVYFETQPPSDFDKIVERMAPRGRIVVMAGRAARPVFPNGPFYVKGLSLFGFVMFAMSAAEQQVCAEAMNQWMASKKLKAVIGQTFKLSEAAAAQQLQEENTLGKAGTLTGKIVVVPD